MTDQEIQDLFKRAKDAEDARREAEEQRQRDYERGLAAREWGYLRQEMKETLDIEIGPIPSETAKALYRLHDVAFWYGSYAGNYSRDLLASFVCRDCSWIAPGQRIANLSDLGQLLQSRFVCERCTGGDPFDDFEQERERESGHAQ